MDLHVVVMILLVHVLYCPCSELTKEFLMIYERCPSRLQKKITEPMKSQVREKVKEWFVLLSTRICKYSWSKLSYNACVGLYFYVYV